MLSIGYGTSCLASAMTESSANSRLYKWRKRISRRCTSCCKGSENSCDEKLQIAFEGPTFFERRKRTTRGKGEERPYPVKRRIERVKRLEAKVLHQFRANSLTEGRGWPKQASQTLRFLQSEHGFSHHREIFRHLRERGEL